MERLIYIIGAVAAYGILTALVLSTIARFMGKKTDHTKWEDFGI